MFYKQLDNIILNKKDTGTDFRPSEYKDPSGRKLRKYLLTRDGCSFLVMGFTGRDADDFKWEFIRAFNTFEQENKLLKSGVIEFDLEKALLLALDKTREAKQLKAENETLTTTNKGLQPKATMYDKVIDAKGLMKVGDVAKLLRIPNLGPYKFYTALRQKGLIYEKGRQPKQVYLERGIFEVKTYYYNNLKTNERCIEYTTYVTPKGLNYIAKLFGVDVPDSQVIKYNN